ncbi:MAG: hypothetical protein IVW53_07295 [Chloroflexi bacterium]|nr:hypothetical protein [Chloroflexota bacterium]
MTPEVGAAIEEIGQAYPRATLTVREDGQGGAIVIVDPVPLAGPYTQGTTWIGFHVTHLHPPADIYPHHVRGDLKRRDSGGLGSGTSASSFEGRATIQLSRRSNRRDAYTDTALLKMERVLEWLRHK